MKRVDNRDLSRSGPGLAELFARPSRNTYELALEIASSSAQYNLGTARTTNMPAVVLEFAHRDNRGRFRYRLGGADRVAGTRVMRVNFEERATPSLIQTPDHQRNMLTTGTLYVEADSGRLWRAEVRSKVASDWKYTVTFGPHKELGMLVPIETREEFFVRNGRGVGVGRYSNFRRFTTSARILPQ